MIKGKGHTSVYEIIERVFDMYDTEDVSFSVLVRHISDAISLLGAVTIFEKQICKINIENYKGELPNNIVSVIQFRYYNENNDSYHAMVGATDSFFRNSQHIPHEHLKYEMSQNHIHTKFESGLVELAFNGYAIDDNGYPLIPNDETIKMALEAYVLERIALKLLLVNKIDNQKYQILAQERNFYMRSAESIANMPTPDKMESIARMMTSLIEKPLSHSRFFRDISDQEYLRIPNKRRFI
jgi:hypothetical protein